MTQNDNMMATHSSVGKLVWFREPPSIGALVRIDDVRRRDGMMSVDFVVLATVDQPHGIPLHVGKNYTVTAKDNELVNLVWKILPLVATGIDEGIDEIKGRYCFAPVTWLR